MSKHLHKTKADPKKKVGTSEPYEGSDLQKRVEIAKKVYQEKREARQKEQEESTKKEETMSDLMGEHGIWKQLKAAQHKVQAEENPEIQEGIKQARNLVKHQDTPKEVTAVFNLIEALNDFKGEISLGSDLMRLKMAGDLASKLHNLYETTKGPYNSKKHSEALNTFVDGCREVMKENYKKLAAEPTLWNFIKDKFNSAMKAIGLTPRGRILDTSLDSSGVIKDETIQARFKDVLKANIEIDDEPDVDTSLRGPK